MKQPTNGNGQGRPPAKMGDMTVRRSTDEKWELLIDGRRVMELTFPQALAIIRGELDVDALRRGELIEVE